ncbi:MAG: ADP-ribosylglycohydrolase family protein [Blautia sp.]|nr:ADP-ribosylglycohydrolase family protein [Blautia sp.]
MFGAVIGDIIGSVYEVHNVKTKDFELFPKGSHFTDDTVLSVAVADALLNREHSDMHPRKSYALWYKQYYRRYPNAGYGQMFSQWAMEDRFSIQRSYGNGGAMRVSAIGYAMDSIQDIRREVNYSCHYTHNHKEAKRGAEAIAICIYLARTGSSKEEIRKYIEQNYKYALPRLDDIRDEYVFDSRTSYSVPPAIAAFLECDSYENAIRNAVSIGGDSDTIACMAGGIAEAYYGGVPEEIKSRAMSFLDIGLKNTINLFVERFIRK